LTIIWDGYNSLNRQSGPLRVLVLRITSFLGVRFLKHCLEEK
jgi:hypothetical protein